MLDIAELTQRLLTSESNYEPEEEQPEPRKIERVTLGDLQITHPKLKQAVDMCHAWKQRKMEGYTNASLVLVGPYGTGKTHIAKSILWSICYTLDDGTAVAPSGKFFEATDLIMKLSPTRNDWGGSDVPRPADFIGDAPILVIDDIGTEQTIPFIKAEEQETERQNRYFRVINYCYQYNISLVITGNVKITGIVDVIGGRAWDRLCEMAPRGFMMDLTGVQSWRQKSSGRAT